MRAAAPLALAAVLAAGYAHAQTLFGAALAVDTGARLVPIARFVSARWAAVPRDGLPQPPREWVRHGVSGRTARIGVAPVQPPRGCEAPQVLRATSPDPKAANDAPLALAVAGQAETIALAQLTSRSPAWTAAAPAVAAVFERRAAGTGVSSSTLARVPLTLDALYAAGTGAAAVYYFEASKRVPDAGNTPEEDPKGIVRVSVSGWLRHEGDRLVPAGTKNELHWEPDDDGVGAPAPTLIPLGVVRQRNEAVWVMADTMGTRRRITLYALGADTVRALFTADVGGC
jgi:hypothetical protein